MLPLRYKVETVSRAGLVYCVRSGIEIVVFVRSLPAPPCDASIVTMAVAGVWALTRLARAVANSGLLSFIFVNCECDVRIYQGDIKRERRGEGLCCACCCE